MSAGEDRPGCPPLLEVRDLKVHFPMATGSLFKRRVTMLKAVDGVSFELCAGETLGVVGESGCGKSTLARAILNLLPTTAGRTVWMGDTLTGLAPAEMRPHRSDLQIIFQDPLASLDPRMTVGDIIAEPLRTLRPEIPRSEVRRRVAAMLERVGLTPQMINRYPHEFSGGQCQRIGVARAMLPDPGLFVCDEPVSALDVSIQAQIVNLLRDLQREFGLALIFISHDLGVVRHISHRIMVLYLGRIMELAGRDDIYRAPASSLHQGADLRGADPRSLSRAPEAAHRADRRPALAAGPAVGLPVPHPLSTRDRSVRRRGAAAGGRERREPPGRLSSLARGRVRSRP